MYTVQQCCVKAPRKSSFIRFHRFLLYSTSSPKPFHCFLDQGRFTGSLPFFPSRDGRAGLACFWQEAE